MVNNCSYFGMFNNLILRQLQDFFISQYENGSCQHMWWMQDGALAHRFLTVRERVTEVLIIVQWHCSIKISGLQDHQTFILLFLWGLHEVFSICHTATDYHWSEPATCSVWKGVLRNLAKFTGKHLWQSLFFNKVAGLRPGFAPPIMEDFFLFFSNSI